MNRTLLLLASLFVGAAGPGPLNATLLGSVKSVVVRVPGTSLPAAACVVNGALNAAATGFAPLGPAVALYRRDSATGPVTLTLPPLIYGSVTGTAAAPMAMIAFSALGTVQLTFTTPKTGHMAFLPGGISVPNHAVAPAFNNYAAVWSAPANRLTVSFDLRLGKCAVPLIAAFQA